MATWQYRKGLHDLGNGCHAYLQPDGGWGWSNAGLVVDGDQALLVDTLFDVRLTREMLTAMRDAVPAARSIGTLVNTHANGDHTFGNQLLAGAEIVATRQTAEEMAEVRPEHLAGMMRHWQELGEGGRFLYETMGSKFHWEEVVYTPPTRTFDKALTLSVGDKIIELREVGPAHTKGDLLVYLPQQRTVFTGDILFVGGHPVLWAGPVENWLAACDLILSWDVDTIVPGHGPITDKAGVAKFRDYLVYIRDEARKRFDAGISVHDAAEEISLEPYADWIDSERITINVASLYRGFGAAVPQGEDRMQVWAEMARYRKAHGGRHVQREK
jgi:glyoxylase-like metal-dependent hydrolase (beta-lactamase superfamily II)